MKGIQYTSKEIYEAKKILYEGSDITRKTLIGALAAFVLSLKIFHSYWKK